MSGEIISFLFLRTLTDSGLSEVEASGSFSFSKFSKITYRNTLGLILKFSILNEEIDSLLKTRCWKAWIPNLSSKNVFISCRNKKLEELDDDDVLELKQHHTTTLQTTQSLKLDDNLSFIEEDNFDGHEQLHASINQYKLKHLGSARGMSEFRQFLADTSGAVLVKFWLDCEFYRDSMQDYDQIENMATRC